MDKRRTGCGHTPWRPRADTPNAPAAVQPRQFGTPFSTLTSAALAAAEMAGRAKGDRRSNSATALRGRGFLVGRVCNSMNESFGEIYEFIEISKNPKNVNVHVDKIYVHKFWFQNCIYIGFK